MKTNAARKWNQAPEQTESIQTKKVKVSVTTRGWVTKGEKLLYAILSVVLIVASGYIISYSSATDQLNRDIQSVETAIAEQTILNEGLSFEVNELSDPARITQIARDNGLKVQHAEVKRVQSFNNN